MYKVQSVECMVAKFSQLEDETKDALSRGVPSVHSGPSQSKDKWNLTGMIGFDKLETFKGEATTWKDWRFKITTWLAQTNPSYESLLGILDQSEEEPEEPEEGHSVVVGVKELTQDQEWCGGTG